MNFTKYDLGQRRAGERIEITLKGSAANVRLMDSANFYNYKNGRSHRYIGGLITKSPYIFQIPRSGRWYVTIDMAGLRGRVSSSIRNLPSALPLAREIPLSSIPSLIQGKSINPSAEENRKFDVFISHASEDKDEIVRPLAHALRQGGLKVWFDEFELSIGDSLRRKIDQGLANSHFGIVILSKSFLNKGWPNYELDGLVTQANSGEQVLLPIWHRITKQEVMEYSPSLADKLARNTSSHTVEEIANEIIDLIQNENNQKI